MKLSITESIRNEQMKLCIFGNKTATKELITQLINSGLDISYLVTLDADKAKKSKIAGQDNRLIKFASNQKIQAFNPENYSLKSTRDISFFQTQKFDLGLCTGWQRLIPKPIIDSFSHGVFGWHGSGFRFPNGRGRSPLNWSLRLGMKQVYHNCFKYAYGVDDGVVYETEVIPIEESDYIADVQRKALEHIKDSSLRLIAEINNGGVNLKHQPTHPYITFPALDESSGEIFPELMSCDQTINLIRSCSRPFPGAYVMQGENKFCVWTARVDSMNIEKHKGVREVDNKLLITLPDGQVISDNYELIGV